jgi:pyrroloquinoline quinone biosynthesis protein B
MKFSLIVIVFCLFACQPKGDKEELANQKSSSPFLIVLGTLQDAGMPHIGCKKDCCAPYFESGKQAGKVVSLGLVDPSSQKSWLFEATPDISRQLHDLNKVMSSSSTMPSGIFLTHAHIGHYAGLMYLGREALGADKMPVFAMPRMHEFLSTNGPWSQLVELGNISLTKVNEKELIMLTKELSVECFTVPHRDEFSETVGFKISGPNKTALFIPDIDKWEKWDRNILEEIRKVDYAFLDATFYSGDELPNRDLLEIPHPLVEESMKLFEGLSREDKAKVYFIHFNHSNPLVKPESEEAEIVRENGFNLAVEGVTMNL